MINSIFIITVMYGQGEGSRCWGWWPTWERALEVVTSNECDLFESGTYEYAVIEEYASGFVGFLDEHWFKIKYVEDKVCVVGSIDKPHFIRTHAFCLG